MGRTSLLTEQDQWEYQAPPSIVTWAQGHVLIAVIGAAVAWFAVVYVLALVVGMFAS